MKPICLRIMTIIVLFCATACRPIQPPSANTAPSASNTTVVTSTLTQTVPGTPATPATPATTYRDPAGLFTVPVPTNWKVTSGNQFVLLTDPDNKLKVYALTAQTPDLEKAIASAWTQIDPAFALKASQVDHPPATADAEQVVVITYATGDDNRIVQAVGQLYKGVAYLMLFDLDLATTQKRSSQISIIRSGFKITAFTQTDLSHVKPLALNAASLAALDAYIAEALQKFDVPGAAVAIVQDGKIVHAKGFGLRDPATGAPVTPETRMMIGSTTKTMTTMMMATLVDDGKMTWDTPVVKFLPNFAVADPALTPQITMRNMVCACTGVPRRDLELIFNSKQMSAQDVIKSVSTFQFFTKFGEAFQYSNQMVAVGGYAATAAASAKTMDLYNAYAQTMQARVLDPIGMPNTTLTFATIRASNNYALPHGLNLAFEAKPLPLSMEEFVTPIAPAGAYWSTVQDMARYLITELNQGISPDGKRVVSAENLQVTWTPQVSITAESSYGLGWIIGEYKGQLLLEHGGNTFGFTSDLAFLPKANVGISVLANAQGATLFTHAVRYRLLELIFQQKAGADQQLLFAYNNSKEATIKLTKKISPTLDTAAITPYLGKFSNGALGEIAVSISPENNALLVDAGEVQLELRPHLGDDGKLADYVIYNPPLAGFMAKLTKDQRGKPTITLGSGTDEYPFVKAE